MRTRIVQATAALALALAGTRPAHAHHSISMFELSTAIWVRGTVVRYEPIAPHAMIYLKETTADGEVQRWRVEGPWPTRLGWILENNAGVGREEFFKPGDVIEVCGFDIKAGINPQRSPDAPAPDGKYTHAQMVVMPDGRMQSWGGYGKLNNCVRPDDTVETWIDFLNADPLARGLWCASLNANAATTTPREFVDAVSSGIGSPCE